MTEQLKMELKEKMVKALREVIASGAIQMDYFDKFCEEMENAGFDTELFDLSDLFELALMEEGLI